MTSTNGVVAMPFSDAYNRADRPHFRYQSSPNAAAIAARKVIDPSGDSIVAETSAVLRQGQATSR